MKPVAHDVARDDRVDLDAVDPARPEDQRGDEISSPSGTDHERREPAGGSGPGLPASAPERSLR